MQKISILLSFFIAMLLFTEQTIVSGQELPEAGWQQPQIRSSELSFDFKQRDIIATEKDVTFSDADLRLSLVKNTGSIISREIEVPLQAADPFLAIGSIWNTGLPDIHSIRISIRSAKDRTTWEKWRR